MLTFWSKRSQLFCDGASRRSFLQVGALAAGGLTLPDLLRLRAQGATIPQSKRKAVIMVTLGGGPSHIDLYDLKPDAPTEIRGEFKPIETVVPGLEISELLSEQARIADKFALVRNLQMSTSSHNQDQEVLSGFLYNPRVPGAKGNPRPAFGSVVSRLRGGATGTPAYVSLRRDLINEVPLYAGPGHAPFVPIGEGLENLGLLKQMTLERFADRKALLQSLDQLRRHADAHAAVTGADAFAAQAFDILSSPQTREAFDLSRESNDMRQKYGFAGLPTYNANYLVLSKFLMARRLVEAGVPVVTLEAFGEWDTHANNFTTLRRIAPVVDRGISALISDLHERGLADDVLVVMWGEFGRSPRIATYNNTPGRDHHGNANFALFAGGGLNMGQVIGATDARGERPTGTPYTPQNILATIYHVLGIDPSTTLPDHFGRPMYLLDEPEAVRELV